MIWFLITRYTAYLWGLPPLTDEARIIMGVVSTAETMGVLLLLIAWLCEKPKRKNNKEQQ